MCRPILNTFADVEARYASVKPLVSENHPIEQDVRPIYERYRKWERIIKISDDCYVLSCGGCYDPVFPWGYGAQNAAQYLTKEDIVRLAPIVWQRHKNGKETIKVSNGIGPGWHNSVYQFLCTYLPSGMVFCKDSASKVYVRVDGKLYPLNKRRSYPPHALDAMRRGGSYCVEYEEVGKLTDKDDGLAVTFERTKTGWVLVGEPPKQRVLLKRVNSEKDEYKEAIRKFREWTFINYPMMVPALQISTIRRDYRETAIAWIKEHVFSGKNVYFSPFRQVFGVDSVQSVAREVLRDESHDLRMAMCVEAMAAIYDIERDWEHRARIKYNNPDEKQEALDNAKKRAFRNFINHACGFTKRVAEER